MIVQLHVRLQHVEPWNCSRFEPVLLVLQLSFQKTHIFLVHRDEFSIDHDLVELRFDRRNELVQNIAEREVSAVALKEGTANLVKCCAIKDELRAENADRVRDIALLNVRGCRWRWRRC